MAQPHLPWLRGGKSFYFAHNPAQFIQESGKGILIVAPVRSARLLWWLPGQAKPSLHGGSRRTWNKCHWSWNVKSRNLPQHKPGSPCKNWWLPTTLQLHFFALHNLYLRPFHTMAAGSCPKVAILAQTLLAPNDQNSIEEQVLNLATTPATVAPVRLARLLWWLPRRAKQSLQRCWRRTSNKRHWSLQDSWWLPTSLQLHFWALHSLYLEPIQTMAAGSCSKVEILV